MGTTARPTAYFRSSHCRPRRNWWALHFHAIPARYTEWRAPIDVGSGYCSYRVAASCDFLVAKALLDAPYTCAIEASGD
jgi:hypothetical protein